MTLHQNVENLPPINPLIHHHFLCDMAIFKQNQMVCTSKFPDHLEPRQETKTVVTATASSAQTQEGTSKNLVTQRLIQPCLRF